MTLNLTSQYYSTSRDFGVIDTDANDAQAPDATVFNADYAHSSVTPGAGDDLVWSPTTSQTDLLGLINNAKHEPADLLRGDGRLNGRRRPCANEAESDGVRPGRGRERERRVRQPVQPSFVGCGVQISYYSSSTGFYIHGKSILADYGQSTAKIFIGSQNFSNTSLTENRELGLIINDAARSSLLDQLHVRHRLRERDSVQLAGRTS